MKRIPGKVIMANLFTLKIKSVNENSTKYRSLTIDTPVLYSRKGDVLSIAYFAGFDKDGNPKVFGSGKTSITSSEFDVITLDSEDVVMLIADQYLQ